MIGLESVAVVIPTIGRASLGDLLRALADSSGPLPDRILLVDDRRPPTTSPLLAEAAPPRLSDRLTIVASGGRGPAAARNMGWRSTPADWAAFLDDDVIPDGDWLEGLASDLDGLAPNVAGSQGRVRVSLPSGRRPTDWERNVAGLQRARWATADLAYRRAALRAARGFDERFPRAYREDADLGLRLTEAGWAIVQGARSVAHPPRPAGAWVSVRAQAGNSDDAGMARLHGAGWRARAGAPRGRRARHAAVAAAGAAAVAGAVSRRRGLAAAAGLAWMAGAGELAWARIAPGPRTPREVATMAATSAALPFAAVGWWVAGRLRWRGARPLPTAPPPPARRSLDAVLLDRDGTLVVDVPYNGDPDRVVPLPGARTALDRLRAAGIRTAVISNQSGVGRGLLSPQQVEAVNSRIEQLLGPLGPWLICAHAPDDGCDCRKPAAGLVLQAAQALGVDPARCAVIGDIGADVEAARAAGARAVLIPNGRTRREEIAQAPEVATDLEAAVDLLLSRPGGDRG